MRQGAVRVKGKELPTPMADSEQESDVPIMKKTYPCLVCRKVFPHPVSLRAHCSKLDHDWSGNAAHHGIELPLPRAMESFCMKTFKRRSDLPAPKRSGGSRSVRKKAKVARKLNRRPKEQTISNSDSLLSEKSSLDASELLSGDEQKVPLLSGSEAPSSMWPPEEKERAGLCKKSRSRRVRPLTAPDTPVQQSGVAITTTSVGLAKKKAGKLAAHGDRSPGGDGATCSVGDFSDIGHQSTVTGTSLYHEGTRTSNVSSISEEAEGNSNTAQPKPRRLLTRVEQLKLAQANSGISDQLSAHNGLKEMEHDDQSSTPVWHGKVSPLALAVPPCASIFTSSPYVPDTDVLEVDSDLQMDFTALANEPSVLSSASVMALTFPDVDDGESHSFLRQASALDGSCRSILKVPETWTGESRLLMDDKTDWTPPNYLAWWV